MKKIIIYGAGKYGVRLLKLLHKLGVNVDYFCVSQTEGKDECCGIPIITIEKMKSLECEKHIFVMIKNAVIRKEITTNLMNSNDGSLYVYDGISFVENNEKITRKVNAGEKYCPLCKTKIADFEAAGVETDIFNRLKIIGGGYREGAICPVCKCSDRERWIHRVLSESTRIFDGVCTVLHIAPEKELGKLIQDNVHCDYYSGDIVQGRAMHMVDVTDIQFKDSFFDYIIMNHVLEHILDEEKALEELRRVLKNDGKLVLSFPICMEIDTLEDKTVCSKEERLQKFGQEDHVRLYGRDFKQRIEKYGFCVEVFSPKEYLEKEEIRKYGLIPDDIVLVCSK